MITFEMCTAAPPAQLLGLSAAVAEKTAEPQSPSTTFKPDKGGGNVAPGEVLLVEAYVAMWLLALALVLLTIFKQRRLDAQIAQLSSELEQIRQQGGAPQED